MNPRRTKTESEIERMTESGYRWPFPERRNIYLYPAQWKMLDEISRVWKKKKRDIFFEAIQQYIGVYVEWKNGPPEKAKPK
jgi:hypothetical protein